MNLLYVLGGIVAIALGGWLTIAQIKWYQKGLRDYSGGHIRLIMSGLALVIGGIIVICQYI